MIGESWAKTHTHQVPLFETDRGYLGYLIMPQDLKPNPRQVQAVVEFTVRESVTISWSHIVLPTFIANFTKITAMLLRLTRKDAF